MAGFSRAGADDGVVRVCDVCRRACRLAGGAALAVVQLSGTRIFRAGAGHAAGAGLEWQGARSTPLTLVIT